MDFNCHSNSFFSRASMYAFVWREFVSCTVTVVSQHKSDFKRGNQLRIELMLLWYCFFVVKVMASDRYIALPKMESCKTISHSSMSPFFFLLSCKIALVPTFWVIRHWWRHWAWYNKLSFWTIRSSILSSRNW